MPQYNLNGLGPSEFERLAQALVKQVIGVGATIFGAGRDGAREATYFGKAPYPSESESWDGHWIFQAKFHDIALLGVDKARKQLVTDLTAELTALRRYKHKCTNYILITNVPLSSVPGSGTRARLESVFRSQAPTVANFAIWGADDISRFLDLYPGIRTTYLEFIVTGDLIARLLKSEDVQADEVSQTIRSYVSTTFAREQNAQLDQAGDVSDDPVQLQSVFFDLMAEISPDSMPQWQAREDSNAYIPSVNMRRTHMVRFTLSEIADKVVLIGGPGEGKSTVGQYLAQLHRATLLLKSGDIALNDEYLPKKPRLPFRVVLKDYGQWLADRIAEDSASGSLDDYLCQQIKAATGRSISSSSLHRVLAQNPTLLILDGLDEVAVGPLKNTLIERVLEFTNRCVEVHSVDLQILATSRPAGYAKQFDPKRFIHLRLVKLEPPQVMAYAGRWVKAKGYDEAKRVRILGTMEECLAHPQIRLMATTPLQVTILAVIIASGGLPPRQREALFDEYLEVIYKRETAKGRYIINSEKEQLIGLHKYVGYLLHEKATDASTSSALLGRVEYDATVRRFLTFQNPYASSDVISAECNAITRDAGDRLVLIVEPVSDCFGFELRSIQEFFAACHLTDTSKSTEQRYSRFEAISALPHWRNVALFFAGRIGRNFSGEVSNIVEVCRAIDRDTVNSFLRIGSFLALELAADRAFGPNARGQRSLLEHALLILEANLPKSRRSDVCDLLTKLPPEDVVDHVKPLLRNAIEKLSPDRLSNFGYAAQSVGLSELVERVLARTASGDRAARKACLQILVDLGPSILPGSLDLLDLMDGLGLDDVSEIFNSSPFDAPRDLLASLTTEALDSPFIHAVVAEMITSWPLYSISSATSSWLPGGWGDSLSELAMSAVTLLGNIRSRLPEIPIRRGYDGVAAQYARVYQEVGFPDLVVVGNIPITITDSVQCTLAAPLWLLHLWFGEPSVDSLSRFCEFYLAASKTPSTRNFLWMARNVLPNPVFDMLASEMDETGQPTDPSKLSRLLPCAGMQGTAGWQGRLDEMSQRLRDGFLEPLPGEVEATASDSPASVHGSPFDELASDYLDYADSMINYPVTSKDRLVRAFHDFIRDRRITMPRLEWIHRAIYSRKDREVIEACAACVRILIDSEYRNGFPQLVAGLLPHCLVGDYLTQDEVRRALNMLGTVDLSRPAWCHFFSPYVPRSSFQRLMSYAVSDASPEVRHGALRLFDAFVESFDGHVQAHIPIGRPVFPGFADSHRSLLGSEDAYANEVGVLLFLVRPPSGAADLEMLGRIVRERRVDRLSVILARLATVRLTPRMRERFMKALREWLCGSIPMHLQIAVTSALDALLGYEDQSLEELQGHLGLPLQESLYSSHRS